MRDVPDRPVARPPHILSSTFLSHARWRREVLSVGPRAYIWLDVFVAAMLRGEWHAFEQQLADGLVRVAAAGADRPGAWPDAHQIEGAANAFRYERGLVAGDDAIAWLEGVGLTIDAWTGYLVRRLLPDRERGRENLGPARTPVEVADADVAAEGICSGAFDRFLRVLAGRAASAVLLPGAADRGSDVDRGCIDGLMEEHAAWLGALDRGEVTERVRHLSQLESTFHSRARAASTPDALASQLARHRVAWTRVDLERLSFDTAAAAREAACCLRHDGITLSEVAIASRRPVRDTRDLLERLDPELQSAVVGAGSDQVVGPVRVGSHHEVAWLLGRKPADLSDPIVQARAQTAVLDDLIAHAIRTHVRWSERPWS